MNAADFRIAKNKGRHCYFDTVHFEQYDLNQIKVDLAMVMRVNHEDWEGATHAIIANFRTKYKGWWLADISAKCCESAFTVLSDHDGHEFY